MSIGTDVTNLLFIMTNITEVSNETVRDTLMLEPANNLCCDDGNLLR